MMTVFDANTIIIIVALLIGVTIAWWIFRRGSDRQSVGTDQRQNGDAAAPPTVERRPTATRVDGPEGNGIADQGAAATADVAGEMLGVRVHGELPGASGPPDNLELMKGVGPKFAVKLQESGIIRFEQLAQLSSNEVAILDERMGPFKGRLVRDRVCEQASYLARDDREGFEAQFGKLGSS